MKCTENGWQAIDYKGCVCDAGYEPDVENRSCIGKLYILASITAFCADFAKF